MIVGAPLVGALRKGKNMPTLIFEKSCQGRYATSQVIQKKIILNDLPKKYLRQTKPLLPEMSELDVVRHYTNLSKLNFSIDTQFYPLGSCTMKYNPRCAQQFVSCSSFLNTHPLTDPKQNQGILSCLYETQEMLKQITGMAGVSLVPMAGAQGEFAGVAMIRAYHDSRNDTQRTEIIVPDAAHGTNPATATMCGYQVKEVPTNEDGDIDLEKLKAIVGPQTAGIMLTNPSTLGVFERNILEIEKIIHQAGGLLYYDGANLNAILGKVSPAKMGFDVMHMNLHKTFATPHGTGGPGAGPIAANEKLLPFMPIPVVKKMDNQYEWADENDYPQSIGKLSAFMGNVGVVLRAYIYMRLLGKTGLTNVAEMATLNANYLMKKLEKAGFQMTFPTRRAVHEFVMSVEQTTKQTGVKALDYAKRLLDYGMHAPTMYFPLIVPECFLIEPTETESKETLDAFVEIMKTIQHEVETNPEIVKNAPHTLPVKRLDEVKAAREVDITYL